MSRLQTPSRGPPAEEKDPHALFDALARPIRRDRGETVCDGADVGRYLYRVASGAARHCALQADGRRRIVDLMFPGDFFGFEEHGASPSTVEALADGTVLLRYPRREIEALADADPSVARIVRDIAIATISRLGVQISLLGRINAVEKVGAFLLALDERRQGAGGDRLTLPVSRCDIGDFLALSPETVSRSLSSLERSGAISLCAPRDVDIVDRLALRSRCSERAGPKPKRQSLAIETEKPSPERRR